MRHTFFFDNCMPPKLSAALRELGEQTEHLRDIFPHDTTDEEWLGHVGSNGKTVITRDDMIRRRPAERQAIIDNGVGAFVIAGKNLSFWSIVRLVVGKWHLIKEHAEKQHRPFILRVPQRGNKFKRIGP